MERTRAHIWVRRYLSQRFHLDKVRMYDIGSGTVQLIDENGEHMNFTCNLFGDIMDADTKEIIAESNCTHNLDKLAQNITQEPTAWTDSYKYFNK